VAAAIHFDDQFCLMAIKIRNKAADDMLLTEPETSQPFEP
jgi:hypothetical protein